MILNCLPRSYESTIQMLSQLNVTTTFDQPSVSLISKTLKQEYHNLLLEDEEALLASFSQQASFQPYKNINTEEAIPFFHSSKSHGKRLSKSRLF